VKTILRMAWRNLWRNRRRTLMTAGAGAFGLGLALCYSNLAKGMYRQLTDDAVRIGSGHLAVYRKGYLPLKKVDGTFDGAGLTGRVEGVGGVEAALPRLSLPGMAQSARGARGAVIHGVDPIREGRVNPYARQIVEGSFLSSAPGDERGVVAGRDLLRNLKVGLGGKLVLTTQKKGGELTGEAVRVRGILATGVREVDGGLVLTTLPFAQRLAGRPDEIHELAVLLRRGEEGREAVAARIRALSPGRGETVVVTWEEAMPSFRDALSLDYATLRIIVLVVYSILGIGVINTQLMAVLERTREIGVMSALGAPPSFSRRLILAEGVLMGLAAGTAGFFLGLVGTWYLRSHGLDLSGIMKEKIDFGGVVFDPVMRARFAWPEMFQLAAALLIIFAAASFFPARRATRIGPAEALRR
jgi:ABC-type lipoprotein release transport system permease subunit